MKFETENHFCSVLVFFILKQILFVYHIELTYHFKYLFASYNRIKFLNLKVIVIKNIIVDGEKRIKQIKKIISVQAYARSQEDKEIDSNSI